MRTMQRHRRQLINVGALLISAIFLSGCLKLRVAVHVEPDGSGTVGFALGASSASSSLFPVDEIVAAEIQPETGDTRAITRTDWVEDGYEWSEYAIEFSDLEELDEIIQSVGYFEEFSLVRKNGLFRDQFVLDARLSAAPVDDSEYEYLGFDSSDLIGYEFSLELPSSSLEANGTISEENPQKIVWSMAGGEPTTIHAVSNDWKWFNIGIIASAILSVPIVLLIVTRMRRSSAKPVTMQPASNLSVPSGPRPEVQPVSNQSAPFDPRSVRKPIYTKLGLRRGEFLILSGILGAVAVAGFLALAAIAYSLNVGGFQADGNEGGIGAVDVSQQLEAETLGEETAPANNSAPTESETAGTVALDLPIPLPTTAPPTQAPVPTLDSGETSPDQLWARNYVGSVDSGGVVIEVARVLFGYKSEIPHIDWDQYDDSIEGWANDEVVGEILFKIWNNSGKTVSIFPGAGTVQIGSEQIELLDYAAYLDVGNVGGQIFPGVTKTGGYWFSLNRSTPAQVTDIVFRTRSAFDENYNSIGPDYEIYLNIIDHYFEEIPDELK